MTPGKNVLYIDNSNIFRGCKKSGWRPSYKRVCEHLTSAYGPLWEIHFFASEMETPREKQARFYRALKGDLNFHLHTYRLAHRKVTCPNCGNEEWIPTEKGVDVGLVIQLLKDLRNDVFETALIMSSDRDYFDAIMEVKSAGRKVKVIAWKWTLAPEIIRTYNDGHVQMIFLEDLREQFEKPQGDVL